MFNSGNSNGYSLADIATATGNGRNNDVMSGGNFWLIIILFIFMLLGWGGNRNGYDNNGGCNSSGVNAMAYPLMMGYDAAATAGVQRGFDQAAIINGLNGIQASVNTGFSNAEVSRCNAQANLLQTLNNNQMGLYQTLNGNQIGILQGFNGVQAQLAQSCSDNKTATQDIKYTLATEACSTRATDTQNTQLILNAINDGFRAMSDQRFQDKIDEKNDEIAQLRQENLYARGQASQLAQNQQIVDSIYNRLDSCPIGTTPVYGRTPIFSCNNGCNCNGNWQNSGCCGN